MASSLFPQFAVALLVALVFCGPLALWAYLELSALADARRTLASLRRAGGAR